MILAFPLEKPVIIATFPLHSPLMFHSHNNTFVCVCSWILMQWYRVCGNSSFWHTCKDTSQQHYACSFVEYTEVMILHTLVQIPTMLLCHAEAVRQIFAPCYLQLFSFLLEWLTTSRLSPRHAHAVKCIHVPQPPNVWSVVISLGRLEKWIQSLGKAE